MLNEQFEQLRKSINTMIDKTEMKMDSAEEQTKKNWSKIKEEVTARQTEAANKINEIEKAGNEASQELKDGAQKAIDDLRKSYMDAKEKVENSLI